MNKNKSMPAKAAIPRTSPTTDLNPTTTTTCPVCTRLNRTLACCRKSAHPHTCTDCAAIDALIARELPDPQTARQEKQDRIESLKLQTKAQDDENERLKATLAEKKAVLQERKAGLERALGRNRFQRRMRAIEKARRRR
tara:strand:- start:33518 stop:33934 length:417 start_codon:yes stop_codon:yes gene_type:complete